MAGEVKIGTTEAPTEPLTAKENEIFEREFPIITSALSFNVSQKLRLIGAKPDEILWHGINDWFQYYKETIRAAVQIAKASLQPKAGAFQGMDASTGFGWMITLPDHLVPTAQGRVWEATPGGTGWRGYIHNGAIGDAYNASPLYMRKATLVVVCGHVDYSGVAHAQRVQYELNGKLLPVANLEYGFQLGSLPISMLGVPVIFKPAVQYRSRAYFKTTDAQALAPLAITFATADWLRSPDPTQPSTTAP